jgi:hypothetical protein
LVINHITSLPKRTIGRTIKAKDGRMAEGMLAIITIKVIIITKDSTQIITQNVYVVEKKDMWGKIVQYENVSVKKK